MEKSHLIISLKFRKLNWGPFYPTTVLQKGAQKRTANLQRRLKGCLISYRSELDTITQKEKKIKQKIVYERSAAQHEFGCGYLQLAP